MEWQIRASRPLRILSLAKQIPTFEEMRLGEDNRLVREGVLHMNDYCRRAVAKGHEIAEVSGGSLTVMTLGPESAETVCREALLFGADAGIHICDPAFAGSDTLATARALAAGIKSAVIKATGIGAAGEEFDLILCGLNSLDADTGQVPPQLAEILGLPFAAGVKRLGLVGDADGKGLLRLELEQDDERSEVELGLPALLSCAERLCDPCKIKDPDLWAQADGSKIERLEAADLSDAARELGDWGEVWGQEASPTWVGEIRCVDEHRAGEVLSLEDVSEAEAIEQVVAVCREALSEGSAQQADELEPVPATDPSWTTDPSGTASIAVIVEPNRQRITRELLGVAACLANEISGRVVALGADLLSAQELGSYGADEAVKFETSGEASPEKEGLTEELLLEEDIASAVCLWLEQGENVWAILAPGTIWGRQVASRIAARQGAGLVGDAIGLSVGRTVSGEQTQSGEQARLVADKPAFGGQMVAEIWCTSPLQMATVRAGVLPLLKPRQALPATLSTMSRQAGGRIKVISSRREDDSDELANAEVVIGIGQGIDPADYGLLNDLCDQVGASLCATRKVTDYGWLPRARQVGITGHSISPKLYFAIGLSGKFNHTVGVRTAGTIVAINPDPTAPIFQTADIGIIANWQTTLPPIITALATS